jgi:zinc transporter ZupT
LLLVLVTKEEVVKKFTVWVCFVFNYIYEYYKEEESKSLNSSFAGFSGGIKQKPSHWIVLATSSFQDYGNGTHIIYMHTSKKKRVNEECL